MLFLLRTRVRALGLASVLQAARSRFLRSHIEGSPTSLSPTTASNDGRSRAWSAEWQHSGKLKSAVASTPRAQPRCKPSLPYRLDGPTQTRDPTKKPGLGPHSWTQGLPPRQCPVGSTTSGAATSATPARTPCERPSVRSVARRRRALASAPFRTGATCWSI